MLFNLSVQFLTNSMLSAFVLSLLLPGRATGCTPSWVGFGRAELCTILLSLPFSLIPQGLLSNPLLSVSFALCGHAALVLGC